MVTIPLEIFVKNKYTVWYFQLIEKRLVELYDGTGEKHHIIPLSIDRSSVDTVILSFREHYIAHLLLTKAVHPHYQHKMLFAITMMKSRVLKQCRFNSKLFASLKEKANHHRSLNLKGRVISEQTREKLSTANKGRKMPDEFRSKRSINSSGQNNPMFGRYHSEESKQKMRENTDVSGQNNPMFGRHRFGEDSPNHNRIWINNGIKRSMIKKDTPVPYGWQVGWHLN